MHSAPSRCVGSSPLQSWRQLAKLQSPVLSDLIGRPIDPSAPLSAPDFSAEVRTARTSVDLHSRPEYEQFAKTREVLSRSSDALGSQLLPRISAFGQLGYGRPGLNPLSDKLDSYWLTGVRLQWSPWNWGITNRDRQVNSLQRDISQAKRKHLPPHSGVPLSRTSPQ